MIRPSGGGCKTSSSSRKKCRPSGSSSPGIAHDLNNPLASVVGFADFLSEVPHVPPPLREPLTVIREEAERASSIVKNLLSFARKQEHQRRPTALKPLLDATFVLLRNQLMAQRVERRIEIEPDLPMPDIDPNQIQQVFVNLINNAAQAIASTGRPGTIVVRARRWLDGVADRRDRRRPRHVRVARGAGVRAVLHHQARGRRHRARPLDQPGHREGARRPHHARHRGGERIDLHGAAAARRPGRPRPPPDIGAGTPTRRLRVLVVDDEPHILHYMRATLEAWGHMPVVATRRRRRRWSSPGASGSTS